MYTCCILPLPCSSLSTGNIHNQLLSQSSLFSPAPSPARHRERCYNVRIVSASMASLLSPINERRSKADGFVFYLPPLLLVDISPLCSPPRPLLPIVSSPFCPLNSYVFLSLCGKVDIHDYLIRITKIM